MPPVATSGSLRLPVGRRCQWPLKLRLKLLSLACRHCARGPAAALALHSAFGTCRPGGGVGRYGACRGIRLKGSLRGAAAAAAGRRRRRQRQSGWQRWSLEFPITAAAAGGSVKQKTRPLRRSAELTSRRGPGSSDGGPRPGGVTVTSAQHEAHRGWPPPTAGGGFRLSFPSLARSESLLSTAGS
jgi:hypothetical protein